MITCMCVRRPCHTEWQAWDEEIGLPRPSHRLLCLGRGVGGRRDWVVRAHSGDG